MIALKLLMVAVTAFDAGTPALVKDVTPGAGGSQLSGFTTAGTRTWFYRQTLSGAELWSTDATSGGTALVKQLPTGAVSALAATTSRVFFVVSPGATPHQLWSSDGTAPGTASVHDFDETRPAPDELTAHEARVFFRASESSSGTELWSSDGTAQGTALLKDIGPSTASGSPYGLTSTSQGLWFFAAGGLWRTDGTPQGTAEVKPAVTGALGSRAASAGGKLFFFGAAPSGGLWASDGTGSGTALIYSVYSLSGVDPSGLTPVGSRVVFTWPEGQRGSEPWVSDGSMAGTALLVDVKPGAEGSFPAPIVAADGRAYFRVLATQRTELWVTDGTAAGTVQVFGGTQPMLSATAEMAAAGESLAFVVDTGAGEQLWVSDGTAKGTRAAGPVLTRIHGLHGRGQTVVFSADDGTVGDELWAYAVPTRDTTAPVLTCPSVPVAVSASGNPKAVTWADVIAVDDRDGVLMATVDHQSGDAFMLGTTTVTATASDSAGNEASCHFDVVVSKTDPTAPAGCGCTSNSSSAAASLLLGAALAMCRRKRYRATA